jgi:hypothetical protein
MPHNDTRTPAPSPDRAPGTAARAEPVPMAVWPCLPPTPGPPEAGVCPPLLAQRLLAVFSRPAAVVLAAGAGSPVVAHYARRLDRRAVLDHAWATGAFPPLAAGRAALTVITPPAVTTDPARYTRWSHALELAGIIAVLAPAGHGPDASLPGRIVAAATAAGLGYLQHVIAITARLEGDRLVPAPSPEQIARTRAAHAAGLGVHLPAHTDVLIFTRPVSPGGCAAQPAPHADPAAARPLPGADTVEGVAGDAPAA